VLRRSLFLAIALLVTLATTQIAFAEEAAKAKAGIAMGDGEANWIRLEGLAREGRVFTFPEVKIASDGWLVLHPFRDGKPVGEIYVGAGYVPAGTTKNVQIAVTTAPAPKPGTMYVAMLHSDVNNDETFDFVFVDELNVADKAVFEGKTMIAHVIKAP
jgi:hypothetical protein